MLTFSEFWKCYFVSSHSVNAIVKFIILFYRKLNNINAVNPKGSSKSRMQSQTHKFKFL